VLTIAVVTTPAVARPGNAPSLPAVVANLAPELKARGGGELTFFGIAVYDGWYWSAARGWPNEGPYALDLHYHRDLDGAKIAQRSVDEIAKLDYGSAAERSRWGEQMARVFPDVRRGDRMTGLHTAAGTVRFFYNDRSIGEIDDPGFARAFFAIWLDPNSSRSDFRRKLLGQQ
jgi:hypothetical protein